MSNKLTKKFKQILIQAKNNNISSRKYNYIVADFATKCIYGYFDKPEFLIDKKTKKKVLSKSDRVFLCKYNYSDSTPQSKALIKIERNSKKGEELKEFWFISHSKSGFPKIEYRTIGIKGINLIEISNMGKCYDKTNYIKKVRITGTKKDGTIYNKFFKGVYDKPSNELRKKYIEMCSKFILNKKLQLKNIRKTFQNYQYNFERDMKNIFNVNTFIYLWSLIKL